ERAVRLLEAMDHGDVRVAHERDGPRLALEPRALDGIRGEGGGQRLERDVALQALVERPEDDAHPASADLAVDAIGPDATRVAAPPLAPRRARQVGTVTFVGSVGHGDDIPLAFCTP